MRFQGVSFERLYRMFRHRWGILFALVIRVYVGEHMPGDFTFRS
jgi:hypothetical protein